MSSRILIFLALVAAFTECRLEAAELHVDRAKPNLVKFISNAKIETFEGITSAIDGYLYWEGDSLTEKSDMYFEVDLNTVDTGIGLRNRHMRENYLETDQYPFTHFKGKIISSIPVSDTTWNVKAKGSIFIHGVEKPLEVDGTIHRTGDHEYRIRTQFVVRLPDFNIEIPSLMFLKIDENMDLRLDFYLSEIQNKEG
jgi:polyisoprenoid-binding protein YceI